MHYIKDNEYIKNKIKARSWFYRQGAGYLMRYMQWNSIEVKVAVDT